MGTVEIMVIMVTVVTAEKDIEADEHLAEL